MESERERERERESKRETARDSSLWGGELSWGYNYKELGEKTGGFLFCLEEWTG